MTSPMKATKLISICIPTYNRVRLLEETLASILSQLSDDVEIVISDNASSDNTQEMVLAYQAKYPCIRYFRNESNLGYDRNLLACLARAEAEYLWFFGSDDLLKEGAIEAVRLRLLGSSRNPTLVYMNHEVFSSDGKVLIPHKIVSTADRELTAMECLEALGLNLGYMSALVLRRELVPSGEISPGVLRSGWVHLYIVMRCLRADGPVLVVGQPHVKARRAPAEYDYTRVFVEQLNYVLWDACGEYYTRKQLARFINRVIIDFHLRQIVAWRCENNRTLKESFPAFLKAYWRFPMFWLLLVPARYTPRGITRLVRNFIKQSRVLGSHP
jgi:O-antigen biosynthesis alpha-1,3-abequosyltransferase